MIADGVLEDPKMDMILGYHNWRGDGRDGRPITRRR